MSDIRFNQWLHQSGTGGVSQVASGAVGVGTTNPLADFYVRGDAQITGILTAGHIAMGSSITFGDDDRAYFGDGTDLQIYHSGSHSFIQDTGTGNLFIDSNSVQIRNAVASKTTAKFIENAQVELYYNNTERIRTTNTGAVVTGILTATGDIIANKASGVGYISSKGGTSGGDYGIVQVQSGSTVRGRLVADAAVDAFRLDSAGRANAPITFHTGSSYTERLRITSGGAVGINQTAPEALLHVENDNAHSSTYYLNSDAAILVDNKNNSGKSVIKLEHDAALVYGSGSSSFIIADRENERVRIDSSGRFLIGKTSGDHILDINASNNEIRLTKADASQYNGIQLDRDASGNAGGYFGLAGNTNHYITGSAQHDICVRSQANLLFSSGGATERFRITSGGNIGIAGVTGTDFSLLDGMVINTGNGSAGLIINSTSSSHNAYMSFGYGSGSGTSHADQYSAYIGRVGDNTLIFGTNNSIRATIDSDGNFNLGLNSTPVSSSTEQGVYLAGADSTQSVISSNVTPFVVNRVGTGGNDRNCIEFRNNGSLKGTVGAVGVNNGIFFQSGVTEVMRITNDYKVMVGMTTTGTSTSNNNFELAGTKMLKVGNMYMGYVIGTGNNNDGVLILHKMGQNVGLQFSGMLTIHSYTGSAYLSGCIVVRYNTDVVTRDLTLQKAASGANFELVSGTISGESGTYFGIKKNGGGTGSFYINAHIGGNIESYGGIREVSNSNWTTDTTHFTVT